MKQLKLSSQGLIYIPINSLIKKNLHPYQFTINLSFTKTQENFFLTPFLVYFMCDGMQNYQSSESGDQQITSSSSCHGQ